ncbi:flagellar export chaperone FliS [Ruminococcaceae bacterium OttesenSCG-928-L11]|nr:flagellar export chaperone FliS [Ruminococcaceae bacterium OttesenSCG-928-L11]
MISNPYQQYKEQSLSTLAPGELLVKLFDEAVKQMRLACIAIEKSDLNMANDSLNKAQTIVSTLAGSLDMRFEISGQLRDMYIFIAQQIHKANMEKSIPVLEETIPLLKELRDSFDQAEKINRRNQHNVGGRAI